MPKKKYLPFSNSEFTYSIGLIAKCIAEREYEKFNRNHIADEDEF